MYFGDYTMRTYTFEIVIESDEDRWVVYSPLLKEKGGATWGYTKEEALKNINEVLEMVVESMIEDQAKWTENDLKGLNLL